MTVEPPSRRNHDVLYSDVDGSNWYFDFDTEEDQVLNGGSFLGTEVYYRIYNNYNSLSSDVNSIEAVNTASNSNSSFTRMEGMNYQPLRCGVYYKGAFYERSETAFIPESGRDSHVRFRLKTYTDSDSILTRASVAIPYAYEDAYGGNVFYYLGYKPGSGLTRYKYVNKTDKWYTESDVEVAYNELILLEPFRNAGGKVLSFDFFDDQKTKETTVNCEPVSGDIDFNYSSSPSEENTYYVQLFAVAKAWDPNNVKNQYSRVLNLGSVPIRQGQ